jgi:hypothetical protein
MKNFYKIILVFIFTFGLFLGANTVKAEGLPTPIVDLVGNKCCLLKSGDLTRVCLKNEGKIFLSTQTLVGCQEDLSNPEGVKDILNLWNTALSINYTTLGITKMQNVDCNIYAACAEFSDQKNFYTGSVSKDSFDLTNTDTFTVKVKKLVLLNFYSLAKVECVNCSAIPGLKAAGGFTITNSNTDTHELTMNLTFSPFDYIKQYEKKLPATVNLEFKASGKDPENKDLTTFLNFPLTIKGDNCKDYNGKENICAVKSGCLWVSVTKKCGEVTDASLCSVLNTNECNTSKVCTFDTKISKCISKVSKAVDEYISGDHQKPDGYTGPLPECAFDGSCRDVNKLVELALKMVDYLFSIVAALAFVFFIYGGYTWIFSFGNPEKIKKGQQIFVYAVIGIIIVFSAYILVDFLLTALGVTKAFRAIN